MNRLFVNCCLFLSLLMVVLLAACTPGDPNAKTTEPSVPAVTLTQVSSSADVVKITTPGISVNAGQSIDATIRLSIQPGFHVNANPPTFPYLIATEITAAKVEGVTAGKPVYPVAVKRKFQFADQPLAVYEGDALVTLPITAGAAKGPRSLPIKLRVQACDEQQCFPPASLNANIQIEVK